MFSQKGGGKGGKVQSNYGDGSEEGGGGSEEGGGGGGVGVDGVG